MWEAIQRYLVESEDLIGWGVGISVFTFLASLVLVPVIVIRVRYDYFSMDPNTALTHTPWRLLRRVAKNVFGYTLISLGIAMLVLPGQGVLTVLLGLGFIDFQGKRSLQLRLLRLKRVQKSFNWIRSKAGKPPLEIPSVQ